MKNFLLLALLLRGFSIFAADAFHATKCEGIYPRHLQGICTNNKDTIYWCWTDFLVKTDTNGHVLASDYTLIGIQTVAQADDGWWFGCYGKPPVLLSADQKLQFTGKWEFNASVGIASIGRRRFLIAQTSPVGVQMAKPR